MINAFDGLTLDCDRADDETDNGSCPLLVGTDSTGFFATNGSCFPDSLPDSAPEQAKICVGLANSNPDMVFTPTIYQDLPEECKAIVYPECR
ncbi:MAG: hypothetical protein JRF15_01035 [Deltaproteobacteria bacterium]|jgi:hypothetical protein|nr:hypothetical protein [Deltaproteobacteria bacterium]